LMLLPMPGLLPRIPRESPGLLREVRPAKRGDLRTWRLIAFSNSRHLPASPSRRCNRDLRRLAEIAALKLVGVPLKEIGPLLAGESRSLDEILQSQRKVLEAKRLALARAVEAIDEACRRRRDDGSTDTLILRALIEAIEMQNNENVLRVFFDEERGPSGGPTTRPGPVRNGRRC